MTNRMANSSTWLAALDGLIALVAALLSALQWNLGRMAPGGITRFLEMRVTLLNATFGAGFVLAWIWIFSSLGLYQLEFRGFLPVLKRVAAACALMTSLFGFYLLSSRTQGPAGAITATFFVIVFAWEIVRTLGGGYL